MNATKDFSKKTVAALAAKNIVVVGTTLAPSEDRGFADAIRCYILDDNGTCVVRTLRQVLELAN